MARANPRICGGPALPTLHRPGLGAAHEHAQWIVRPSVTCRSGAPLRLRLRTSPRSPFKVARASITEWRAHESCRPEVGPLTSISALRKASPVCCIEGRRGLPRRCRPVARHPRPSRNRMASRSARIGEQLLGEPGRLTKLTRSVSVMVRRFERNVAREESPRNGSHVPVPRDPSSFSLISMIRAGSPGLSSRQRVCRAASPRAPLLTDAVRDQSLDARGVETPLRQHRPAVVSRLPGGLRNRGAAARKIAAVVRAG